jgi:predicted esterase
VETWIVHTRACEQKLGSDPWSSITIGRLDEGGGPLHAAEPDALFARMSGRPSVFFVHGAGYTYQDAVEEAVNIRTVLEANGGFSPETLFVAFDWPSERELGDFIQDLNEQSRRSRVASYHLARFLQSAPPDSRICLMGQSNGGRIVLMAVHLLSGAPLQPFWTEPEVALTSSRSDLRIRAVLVDAAAGHHWLNPGERLHQALPMCESLLNLRNCADYALSVYVFGIYTGLRPPIGQVGLTARDLRVLGPLSARVEQINMHSRVGFSHTSIPQALGLPDIAERIAHYTSWSDVSQPARR